MMTVAWLIWSDGYSALRESSAFGREKWESKLETIENNTKSIIIIIIIIVFSDIHFLCDSGGSFSDFEAVPLFVCLFVY